uniref:Uncharacterized protein n=1 Tax=Esox lucius TaxID=8010 RepID=A0A3P8YVB8_ESOLU
MAASLMSMRRTFRLVPLLAATPRHWSSNPGAPPPLQTRLLLYLSHRFHDVETLLSWIPWLKSRGVRQKNIFYGYTQENFGDNVAAAFYILSLRGGFRFAGQSEWFRSNKRGKFSWDFINQRDATIEEVDASNTLINYTGLENLVKQKSLRTLSLCGCVEVDDWFLSRLHVFQDTLEELDISHCPQITVGGLASLRNLRYTYTHTHTHTHTHTLERIMETEVFWLLPSYQPCFLLKLYWKTDSRAPHVQSVLRRTKMTSFIHIHTHTQTVCSF